MRIPMQAPCITFFSEGPIASIYIHMQIFATTLDKIYSTHKGHNLCVPHLKYFIQLNSAMCMLWHWTKSHSLALKKWPMAIFTEGGGRGCTRGVLRAKLWVFPVAEYDRENMETTQYTCDSDHMCMIWVNSGLFKLFEGARDLFSIHNHGSASKLLKKFWIHTLGVRLPRLPTAPLRKHFLPCQTAHSSPISAWAKGGHTFKSVAWARGGKKGKNKQKQTSIVINKQQLDVQKTFFGKKKRVQKRGGMVDPMMWGVLGSSHSKDGRVGPRSPRPLPMAFHLPSGRGGSIYKHMDQMCRHRCKNRLINFELKMNPPFSAESEVAWCGSVLQGKEPWKTKHTQSVAHTSGEMSGGGGRGQVSVERREGI